MSNPRLEDMCCAECNRPIGECACAGLVELEKEEKKEESRPQESETRVGMNLCFQVEITGDCPAGHHLCLEPKGHTGDHVCRTCGKSFTYSGGVFPVGSCPGSEKGGE